MSSTYPGALDSFTNPSGSDQTQTAIGGRTHSQMHRDINDCIEAIEAELGTDPAGAFSTVKARLDAMVYTMSPKVNGWVTADDIRTFVTGSNQGRVSGDGPALGVRIYKAMTVDALACIVDTLEAASTIRLGLYSSDSDGYPTTLLGSVSVPGTSTGQQSNTFGSPIALTPGLYWLVARVSSTTTLRLRACIPTHHSAVGISSLPQSDNSYVMANFGTSSSLNTPISTFSDNIPDNTILVGMRRSA